MAKPYRVTYEDDKEIVLKGATSSRMVFIDKATMTAKAYTHGGSGYYAHGLDWRELRGTSVEDVFRQVEALYNTKVIR